MLKNLQNWLKTKWNLLKGSCTKQAGNDVVPSPTPPAKSTDQSVS